MSSIQPETPPSLMTDVEVALPTKAINRGLVVGGDVKKSHELVFSRQKLSAREQDILTLMLGTMKISDWGTEENPTIPTYRIPTSEIAEQLDVRPTDMYATLKLPCAKLANRSMGFFIEEKQKFIYRGLFKEISYTNGILTLIPNDRLRAAYIGGAKGYALVDSRAYHSLNREPSKRLYDLMSRFKKKQFGKLNKMRLEELKGMFGLFAEDGQYRPRCKSFKNNSTFINRYIVDSIKEFQSNAHIRSSLIFHESDDKVPTVGYKLYKTGNKYTDIEFLYSWTDSSDEPLRASNFDEAIAKVNEIETFRAHLKKSNKKLSIHKLTELLDNYKVAHLSAPDELSEEIGKRTNVIAQALAKRIAEDEALAQKAQEQKNRNFSNLVQYDKDEGIDDF